MPGEKFYQLHTGITTVVATVKYSEKKDNKCTPQFHNLKSSNEVPEYDDIRLNMMQSLQHEMLRHLKLKVWLFYAGSFRQGLSIHNV